MKSNVYVVFCLSATLGLTSLYGEVKEYLSRPDEYIYQIERLTKANEAERLRHLVTLYEFEDFRQEVGTVLPDVIREKGPGEKSYPARNIASITQKGESDKLMFMKAATVFESGRALFRAGRYPEAAKKFAELIRDHAYSINVLEAMFLKLESHFQLRQYDEVVAMMEKMVDTFPESELTGYAMLRVGKIYEQQDRFDDAHRIYKTVLASFPDRGLAAEARSLLE